MFPGAQTANVILILLACLQSATGLQYDDVKKAFDIGLENYNPYIRPVLNQSNTIDVNIAFYLMRISSVRENEKTLQSTGFMVVLWKDQLMEKWLQPLCAKAANPCTPFMSIGGTETFENISSNYLHVSPDSLWLPDLRLHNAVRKFGFDRKDALLTLYYTGEMTWVPGGEFETFCEMDVRKFPFDKHSCHFDIGPWQSNRELLTSSTFGADLTYFEKDGQWVIGKTYLQNASYIIGGCCRYTIEIQRRPEILVATMILPTSILSFVGTLVFKLPTESGERVSLSVSVTLALILYLTIIQNILPRSVTKPAYFEVLLCSQVILNLFNVFFNAVNIYIYHKMRTTRYNKRSFTAKILLKLVHKDDVQIEHFTRNRVTVKTIRQLDRHVDGRIHDIDTISTTSSSSGDNDEDTVHILVPGSVMSEASDKLFLSATILVNVLSLAIFSFLVLQ